VPDVEAFFRIARAGFSTRRKQLRNALANGLGVAPAAAAGLLAAAGIDAALRAQALSLDQWAALARAWVDTGRPEGER
jgi:16S rRNA (adenine1518-N6/adenine1519-N6)-dimethyltransferase